MKKFKRLIALVTVAMFLISFAAPVSAASFSDLASSNATSDIYRLNALGVINGYPDGTFKPANNITRAEFAVIAMSAAGLKGSADVLKNSPSKFSDVKAGEWFTGWVNLAASQGFINGYPDGTFKPNNNISYAEVITILVRILGYNEKLPGTWPTEYIVKAGELGITDDVTFAGSGLATRGDVAILSSATLDEDLVVYDKDTEEFTDKYTPAQSLFENKFDGYEYKEDGLKVDDWGMNADNQYTVTVSSLNQDNPETAAVEDDWVATKKYTLADNVVINGAATVPDLKGHLITFNYNTDDEELTYINVTSKVVKAANDADTSMDTIKDPTVDSIKLNDVAYSYSDAYVVAATKYDGGNGLYKFMVDADNEIYTTAAYTAGNYNVVDEYNATTQKLSFKDAVGVASGTLELKDKDVLVIKDGKVASAADIKEDDLVEVSTTVTGLDYYLSVKTVSTTGKVSALYGAADPYDSIKVGGAKYHIAADALISTDNGENYETVTNAKLDDVNGLDVKYFLNKNGTVAVIISDKEAADNTNYGIVTDVVDETLKGEVTKVKILKADGTVAEYSVDIAEIVIDWDFTAADPAADTDVDLANAAEPDDAVSYKLDANGKIIDLDVLALVAGSLDDAVKDSNKLYIEGSGWFYLDSETVILNGRGAEDAAKETNSDLLKYLEDAVAPANLAAWVKTDGNKVDYVLLGTDLGVVAENKAMVVDKYIQDGDLWIDVDVRGTVESYEAAAGETYAGTSVNNLYAYTMSGSKLDLGAIEAGLTATEVYDKDTVNKSIKVSATEWYEIDADTYIYDLTGTTPVYITDLSEISKGDNIQYKLDVVDADRVGVIDVLYIVD